MKNKLSIAMTLAIILSMAATSLALADSFSVDNDVFSPGNQATVNLSAAPGAIVNTSAQIVVDYQGSKHLTPSTSISFLVNTSQTDLPSGYTVSVVSSSVPSDWNDTTDQFVAGTSNISFTAPSTPGSYSYTVKWNDTDTCSSSGDCLTGANAFTINLTVTAPSNTAPTVSDISGDTTVNEGDTKTYSVTASDPDNDPLTYAWSITSGNAKIPGASNGSSVSVQFTDGPSTVGLQVVVDDGQGHLVTKSLSITENNVAPTITSVVAGAAASCGADNTITVNFTDPGTLDTWSATVDWGDGNADNMPSVTSGFGASHMYVHAGVYTVTVTVTDDDGGVSALKTANVTLNYSMSGILQPINPGPPNSVFKYGSTIPVKVRVQDCDGSYPGNLMLKVTWQLLSSGTPGGDVSEPFSTSAADSGNTMRFTGAPDYQYIFNLASKSFPDGTATYRIYVTIASTNQTVSADIGLKSK